MILCHPLVFRDALMRNYIQCSKRFPIEGCHTLRRYTNKNNMLGGGFKYFLVSPRNLGKISNLTDIFQMGWNHHLAWPSLNNGVWKLFSEKKNQGCRTAGQDQTMPVLVYLPFPSEWSYWLHFWGRILTQGCLPTQNWNVPTLFYYCNKLSQVIHPEKIKPRFCFDRASHARYLMERTCFF